MLPQALQDSTYVLLVLLFCAAKHQYIVHIHQDKCLHALEHVRHDSHKSAGCIAQAKWHYGVFKVAEGGGESSLAAVFWAQADLIIAGPQIQGALDR